MLFARYFYKLECLREVENLPEIYIKSRNREIRKYGASNNLNTCLEIDSLLHIETKKQTLVKQIKTSTFIQSVYLVKLH